MDRFNGEAGRRLKRWLEETGLALSDAGLNRVFPGLGLRSWESLAEFDHKKILFAKDCRVHVVLVEPYHTADKAILAAHLEHHERGLGFSHAKGPDGSGIHYPRACHPVIMARSGYQELCDRLAAKLPF